AIFEQTAGDVAREAGRIGKCVGPAVLHMEETELLGADPDAALVIAEQLVGTDCGIRELLTRIDCTADGISLDFVADQSLEAPATNADQKFPVGRRDQVGEWSGHFIPLGRPGFPSPQSGSRGSPQDART